MSQHQSVWQEAKQKAEEKGLEIVEVGWEQHVVVDEANGYVYRLPKHDSGLAKLKDEVTILKNLEREPWPVPIPKLLEFDGRRAKYNYIPGEPLDSPTCHELSDDQMATIGKQLGIFLAQLHKVDTSYIEHIAWQQIGSLFDYYKKRIRHDEHNPYTHQATRALEELTKLRTLHHTEDVVVHGDLHGLNMIISPETKRLVGVIDLSEIEVGDPHQDFRKLFMTDPRILEPSVESYELAGGQKLSLDLIKLWAYVNEWANVCYFATDSHNTTYKRALANLKRWDQLP